MAEAAHRSAYSYKQARGHPPSHGVPTANWLIGTLMVCANIYVGKPAYRKGAFLVCIPRMGRSSAAPPSGYTGSHAPFIHPKHQQTETGKTPPTAQGEWGEGGAHHGRSTLIIDKQKFFFKGSNSTGPIMYNLLGADHSCYCPLTI